MEFVSTVLVFYYTIYFTVPFILLYSTTEYHCIDTVL